MHDGSMALSGYRILWLMVMFDLPVGTQDERRGATKFREFLLDQGFEMAQFSVYMRFCAGKEQAQTYLKRIEKNLPAKGSVYVLTFTDKQYENIVRFSSREKEAARKNPGQLALF